MCMYVSFVPLSNFSNETFWIKIIDLKEKMNMKGVKIVCA